MKLTTRLFMVMVAVFFILPGHTCAHFLWIKPFIKDKNAEVRLMWGHHLQEKALYPLDDIKKVYAFDTSGRRHNLSRVSRAIWRGRFFSKNISFLVAEREGFITKTTEGFKKCSKKGVKNVIKCAYAGKYAKAWVGEKNMVLKRVGHKLEIIPLKNPGKINKEGEGAFPFKVFWKGKPLATTVRINYLKPKSLKEVESTITTNGSGVFNIKMAKGTWLLTVNLKRPYSDPQECDFYVSTATFYFEIQ